MLSKEEIEQLQNVVRDNSLSVEKRKDAFLQLQEQEASVLDSDLEDYYLATIASSGAEEDERHKHRLYDNIAQRLQIGIYNKSLSSGHRQKVLVRSIRFAGGIAAALLTGIALVVLYQNNNHSQADKGVLASNEASASANNGFDTLINNRNRSQRYLLPDSSLVELGPHSYVYYQKGFASNRKAVFLQGEASFSVHKTDGKPFSVYVNDMEVRDLGTVFYIKSEGNKLKVLLIKGKVLVHSMKPSLTIPDIALVPGQEFAANTLSGKYSLGFNESNTNRKKDTSSLDFNEMLLTEALSFNNTPIDEVLQSLQKEFNVTIKIHSQQKDGLLFTGQFTEYMSLAQILSVISRSYNLDIHVGNSSIILKSK